MARKNRKVSPLVKLAHKCHCSTPYIAPYAHGLRLDVYTVTARDGQRVAVLRGLSPLKLAAAMLSWARTVKPETIEDCDPCDCPEPGALANVG